MKRITQVATWSLVSTVIVVAVKLVAAWLSGSISVLAEGMQSLLDVVMSALALVTVRVASRPADEDHPWGHGKAEVLLSALQMLIVIATAIVIAWQASRRLLDPGAIEVGWGLGAMVLSVVMNSLAIFFLRKVGREEKSEALIGEAAHLQGDTLASLGVLGGLVAYALIGWKPLDPLVAIVFTLLGAYFAVRQLNRLVHQLMDGALPASEVFAVESALHQHPEVKGFHQLLTRQSGSLREVTLHVLLDDRLSFVEAHDLAEEVESELSAALGGARVTVHYEPFEAEMEHRRDEHGDVPVVSGD